MRGRLNPSVRIRSAVTYCCLRVGDHGGSDAPDRFARPRRTSPLRTASLDTPVFDRVRTVRFSFRPALCGFYDWLLMLPEVRRENLTVRTVDTDSFLELCSDYSYPCDTSDFVAGLQVGKS